MTTPAGDPAATMGPCAVESATPAEPWATTIERILPPDAVAVEAYGDIDAPLFAEERLALGSAVDKRRREFVTARACARAALQTLGLPAVAIPAGERGQPCWPAGVVGSITHCDGYRACALAPATKLLAIGIDAEPNAALPDGVLEQIAGPQERLLVQRLASQRPDIYWDRLLFSAKESIYKAWFPLTGRWLGFEEAEVVFQDAEPRCEDARRSPEDVFAFQGAQPAGEPRVGSFAAHLLVANPPRLDGAVLRGFSGRWIASDTILATIVAVDRRERGEPLPTGCRPR